MDLNERFNILAQAVELAQKNGSLSLDEAVEAKKNIEAIQRGENLKECFSGLVKICEDSQKKGVFTLHDAYVVYIATENIDAEIDKFLTPPAQPEVPAGAEMGTDVNAKQAEWTDDSDQEKKKASKKKGK